MVVVALAAIIGDSAGYEVGKHLGILISELKVMNRRLARFTKAQRIRASEAVRRCSWAGLWHFSAPSCPHWPGPSTGCTLQVVLPLRTPPRAAWRG